MLQPDRIRHHIAAFNFLRDTTSTSISAMDFQEQNIFDCAFVLQDGKTEHHQICARNKAIGSYHEEPELCQVRSSTTFYPSRESISTDTLPELSPTPSCNDLPLQEIRLELARTIHLPIAIPRKLSLDILQALCSSDINPKASNLFGVKHLSHFVRCYPPALNSIQTPIS